MTTSEGGGSADAASPHLQPHEARPPPCGPAPPPALPECPDIVTDTEETVYG